jgi:hypothetical protein
MAGGLWLSKAIADAVASRRFARRQQEIADAARPELAATCVILAALCHRPAEAELKSSLSLASARLG